MRTTGIITCRICSILVDFGGGIIIGGGMDLALEFPVEFSEIDTAAFPMFFFVEIRWSLI